MKCAPADEQPVERPREDHVGVELWEVDRVCELICLGFRAPSTLPTHTHTPHTCSTPRNHCWKRPFVASISRPLSPLGIAM